MLCRLVSLALVLSVVNGQIESPSFPSDAPTAHPIISNGSVDAPSSIESALLAQQPQETSAADLINLDQFNIAEVEDTAESVCFLF